MSEDHLRSDLEDLPSGDRRELVAEKLDLLKRHDNALWTEPIPFDLGDFWEKSAPVDKLLGWFDTEAAWAGIDTDERRLIRRYESDIFQHGRNVCPDCRVPALRYIEFEIAPKLLAFWEGKKRTSRDRKRGAAGQRHRGPSGMHEVIECLKEQAGHLVHYDTLMKAAGLNCRSENDKRQFRRIHQALLNQDAEALTYPVVREGRKLKWVSEVGNDAPRTQSTDKQ